MKCRECDGAGEKFILPRGNPFNMRLPQLAQAMVKVQCFRCHGSVMNDDGTERLCQALYGRKATARDYLGGSDAKMLHDAADKIIELAAEVLADTNGTREGATHEIDPKQI